MQISDKVPQLRTTDLEASVAFYTGKLGMTLAFRHLDFYAGIRAGTEVFHLKLADSPDPSIPYGAAAGHFHLYFETPDIASALATVRANGVEPIEDIHDTAWGTREFVIRDDQGHILYFGQDRSQPLG